MVDVAWLLFTFASLVLIVTPGQDMVLVMSRSIAQGASAGVVTAAGVSVGLVGHTVLATLGLGAVLRASEWLFVALKLVGAAYLVYLGIGLLRTRTAELVVQASSRRSLARLFLDGTLSNISNPKIAIFYSCSGWCSRRSRSWSRARSGTSPASCRAGCVRAPACWPGCTAPAVPCWSRWVSGSPSSVGTRRRT